MLSEFFCSCRSDSGVAAIAWVGALVIVAHAVIHGYVKYAVNSWYGSFYTLLEAAGTLAGNSSSTDADWSAKQAEVYSGLWDFSEIALVAVIVMPLAKWVRSVWALRWRLALMRAYVLAWDGNKAPIEGASQRVHEDSYRFSRGVELCLTTGLDAFITLAVFIPVLNDLGSRTACPDSLSAFSFMANGWLVGVAIFSAVVGLLVTVLLGHKLVGLEVENQVVEAQLRRDLVILETAPGNICAVYHVPDAAAADDAELVHPDSSAVVSEMHTVGDCIVASSFLSPLPHFLPIMDGIRRNYDRLFLNFTALNLWLALFDQFNVVLPYLVFAPLLFSPDPHKRIMLGTLVQVSNAFDKVFGALSVISENYAGINEFRSVLVRLRQFERNIFFGVPYPSRRTPWSPILRTFSTTRVALTRFGEPVESGAELTAATAVAQPDMRPCSPRGLLGDADIATGADVTRSSRV
jgi:peptide/bleomycin uptake transporter